MYNLICVEVNHIFFNKEKIMSSKNALIMKFREMSANPAGIDVEIKLTSSKNYLVMAYTNHTINIRHI